MRRTCSHIGTLCVNVQYSVLVQMNYRYDPGKLEAELKDRAHNMHVIVEPAVGEYQNQHCYRLTFAREGDLESFYTALTAIDAELARIHEDRRLALMLAE